MRIIWPVMPLSIIGLRVFRYTKTVKWKNGHFSFFFYLFLLVRIHSVMRSVSAIVRSFIFFGFSMSWHFHWLSFSLGKWLGVSLTTIALYDTHFDVVCVCCFKECISPFLSSFVFKQTHTLSLLSPGAYAFCVASFVWHKHKSDSIRKRFPSLQHTS